MRILVCGAGHVPTLPRHLINEIELVHIDSTNKDEIIKYAKDNSITCILANMEFANIPLLNAHDITCNDKFFAIDSMPTILPPMHVYSKELLYSHNSPIYINRHNKRNNKKRRK